MHQMIISKLNIRDTECKNHKLREKFSKICILISTMYQINVSHTWNKRIRWVEILLHADRTKSGKTAENEYQSTAQNFFWKTTAQ